MATKVIAWTTGSGYITLTYTGQGDGTILVSSDDNTGAARSQTITIQTTEGTPVVTKNITINQAAYVPPFVSQDFSYTGTVQSCTLPPGTYRLQCWGAQGGSNPSDSTYGISSYNGGKGGYSEGILKLTSTTTVYIFVGGQPSTSSTNGGWNGGGGGSGTSTNGTPTTATYGLGVSKVGRGGGATDIALTTSTMSYSSYRTNRSSASLLSRFIVAGGGSGGGGALQRITESTTSWNTVGTIDCSKSIGTTFTVNGYSCSIARKFFSSSLYYTRIHFETGVNPFANGDVLRFSFSNADSTTRSRLYWSSDSDNSTNINSLTYGDYELTWSYSSAPSGKYLRIQVWQSSAYYAGTVTIEKQETTSTTTDNYSSQTGYVGGGVEGGGSTGSGGTPYYSSQDAAGNRGDFGFGANQVSTSYRYVSPCGGGGWYGGGNGYLNATSDPSLIYSGGGSGFVNIAENAQYRPSGYTGLELDSGATYAGNTSFPSTSGSTEIGHSGDGYARITRVDPNQLIPLTFDILGDGTIGWKAQNSSLTKTIQYRKNGGNWTSITSTTSGVTFSVASGDVVQFRGNNTAYGNASYYNRFTATCQFKVRGNIMSLINSTSFESLTTLTETGALRTLFYQNTYLIDASELLLPATTLSARCYQGLFNGCTNLTAVPVLPAATLASNAYNNLFNACSSLTYIKCLATDISASNCTGNWVNGVAATGTFVKASTMSSWTTGNAGIPSGWTVQDA